MFKISTYALAMAVSLLSFFQILSYFGQLEQAAGGASLGTLRGFYIFASFFGIVASLAAIVRILMLKKGLAGTITKLLFVVVVLASIVAIGGSALFALVKIADIEGKSALLTIITGSSILDILLMLLLTISIFLSNYPKERKDSL